MSIMAKLGGLFGSKGPETEFDKLGRDLRSLGVKAKVVDEFERVCGEYPESAALGLDSIRGVVSGAWSNPNPDPMALTLLEGALVGTMTAMVQHATGKMPNLSHLLS